MTKLIWKLGLPFTTARAYSAIFSWALTAFQVGTAAS